MVDTPLTMAASLLAAGAKVELGTRAEIQVASRKVRDKGRANSVVSSGRSAAQAPSTITYETGYQGLTAYGEIGYEARGQGNIGHILERGREYGNVRSAPHRDLGRALDEVEDSFPDSIAVIGVKAID